jgi:hypothetical protein
MSGTRGPWIVILPVAWLAGGWVAATLVGTLLDDRPPALAVGSAVAIAAVTVGVVPLALAVQGWRWVSARQWSLGWWSLWGGSTSLVALGVIVAAQLGVDGGLGALWSDRRTWLLDGLTGAGPHGSAAAPVALARAAELAAPAAPGRAAELLCGDAARAALAAVATAAREPVDGLPGARTAAWDALEARGSADPRGALQGAFDTVAATLGDASFPAVLSGPVAVGRAGRAELPLTDAAGTASTAVLEAGAWRVCPPPEAAAAAGRAFVEEARAAALAERPQGPAADELAARDVLRAVVEGRTAWALGVPAAPGFAAALSPAAAVLEAERIRGWCRGLAAGDPALAPAVEALDARWASEPGRLPAEGRALLAEVEAACAPVAAARLLVEGARGLPGSADDRRRWARLEGASAASAAALTKDGATFRAVVALEPSGAGPLFVLVPDGAGWIVDGVH